MFDPCFLHLTCKDEAEARRISEALLIKRYVVCAKQISATSTYWWRGKVTSDKEILLVMESDLKYFDTIESMLKKDHNYDTFVLQAVPITRLSEGATVWMQEELTNEQA